MVNCSCTRARKFLFLLICASLAAVAINHIISKPSESKIRQTIQKEAKRRNTPVVPKAPVFPLPEEKELQEDNTQDVPQPLHFIQPPVGNMPATVPGVPQSVQNILSRANSLGLNNLSPGVRHLLTQMLMEYSKNHMSGGSMPQVQGRWVPPNYGIQGNGNRLVIPQGSFQPQNLNFPPNLGGSVPTGNGVQGPLSLLNLTNNPPNAQQMGWNNIPNAQIGSGYPSINSPPYGDMVTTTEIPDPINDANVGPETRIMYWTGKQWTQLHRFCSGNLPLKRTLLKSPVGQAIIYIHDLKDDKWVSGALKANGLWDLGDVKAMIQQLQMDPEIGFIDIGSHVGTFSLVAAIMGRKVVSVDPLLKNVVRLCRSSQANNFTGQITVLYTAISNGYKRVSFNLDIGNVGGTRIVEVPQSVRSAANDPNFINTVRLDDIIQHVSFRKAFIKMDVEEHEFEVVSSGARFFQEIDVRGILMEWMWQRTGKNGLKLRNMLAELLFRPFFPDGSMELVLDLYQAWPDDVLWLKIN